MKLESVFSTVFSVPSDSINDQVQLRDISTWDSMTHMVLIYNLEAEFNIQLTGDEIAEIQTVGDARRFLVRHGVNI